MLHGSVEEDEGGVRRGEEGCEADRWGRAGSLARITGTNRCPHPGPLCTIAPLFFLGDTPTPSSSRCACTTAASCTLGSAVRPTAPGVSSLAGLYLGLKGDAGSSSTAVRRVRCGGAGERVNGDGSEPRTTAFLGVAFGFGAGAVCCGGGGGAGCRCSGGGGCAAAFGAALATFLAGGGAGGGLAFFAAGPRVKLKAEAEMGAAGRFRCSGGSAPAGMVCVLCCGRDARDEMESNVDFVTRLLWLTVVVESGGRGQKSRGPRR